MLGKIKYTFSAKSWEYSGKGAWHFVSVPEKISKEIRGFLRSEEEGWGRLKAIAQIGNTQWPTAIWFATKSNTYLLPLKAEIRKQEKIIEGKTVKVTIWV